MMSRWAVVLVLSVATCARGESWQEMAAAFFSDDDCETADDERCALNALQVGRCIVDFNRDVRVPLLEMVQQLQTMNNKLVIELNEAESDSKEDDNNGLLPIAKSAHELIREVGPKFMMMLNNTNAIKRDPGLEQYGPHAVMQEDSLLEMLKFTVVHAGMVMHEVIYAASHNVTNYSFAIHVNADAQAARAWLKSSLKSAWLGAKDMLPRIQALVNNSYGSPTTMAKQAACASNTASGISKLTTLYSDIVTAGSDCNVSDMELFSAEDCQSSALNVQSGIDGVIEDGADIMWNCYHSSWICAKSIALTSKNLIQSFMSTIVMRSACKSTDDISLAVCKSESFQLLAGLAAASSYMFETTGVCESPCRR
ncbi:unnamed protein product [Symbiodinium sp. KB8]|nr:unnamed protein product [Symbiodinium sp. KB8]